MKNINHNVDNFLSAYVPMKVARDCLIAMESMNNQISDLLIPFHYLASTSLELFAKSALFLSMEKNNKSIDEIGKKLQKLNHDLDKLYSEKGVGIKLVKKQEDKKNDFFIFRYVFDLKDKKEPVYIYHTESLRYGPMAKKRNDGFAAYQTDLILDLCKKIESATISIFIDYKK